VKEGGEYNTQNCHDKEISFKLKGYRKEHVSSDSSECAFLVKLYKTCIQDRPIIFQSRNDRM
jgi:hypothetical protein